MRKYFLAFVFIAYLFLFGLFTLSADILPTFAVDCDLGLCKSGTAPPGTLQCSNSCFSSKMIQECQSDGTWKDYYDCNNEVPPDSCENIGLPPNGAASARCTQDLEGPSPTPPGPTSTPPSSACSGGYNINQTKCESDRVLTCEPVKDSNGNPTAVGQWITPFPASNKVCAVGGCIESPKGSATCSTLPTPTPTPSTSALTPTPDPNVQCSFLDFNGNDVKYNAGVSNCVASTSITQLFPRMYQCQNSGEMKEIGTCNGTCITTLDSPPNADFKCLGVFEPISENPACIRESKAAQQMVPQPGVNCGIPIESIEGEDKSAAACCYSAAADLQVMPLSCFIGIPGGENMLNKLSDKINTIFDCMPSWENCSKDTLNKDVLTVGAVKKALKEVLPCMPRTIPAPLASSGLSSISERGNDNNGVPLCTCMYESTDTSRLCNTIMTTDDKGNQIPDEKEQTACRECMLKDARDPNSKIGDGIWTAVGCINISRENGFIASLFQLGISLGGAFALLCNIYGAFLFQTSRGSPEGLKKAQDMITSCITGLLLIIFSVFILRLIGYNILRIPGFG